MLPKIQLIVCKLISSLKN